VRRAVLRGELVAGQRLIEPDLAEVLGVNRSSVRAALIDLAAEGLVERMPSKGARVQAIGEQLREAVEKGRFARYSQLNMELHQRIREISGQFAAFRATTAEQREAGKPGRADV
jgi:DNA-binding GntR family transcriptional regulator